MSCWLRRRPPWNSGDVSRGRRIAVPVRIAVAEGKTERRPVFISNIAFRESKQHAISREACQCADGFPIE